MSCICATFDPDTGRYECSVSGDQCMFLVPNSKACAKEYGEGPDAEFIEKEEENNMDMKIKECEIIPGKYKDAVHAIFDDGTEKDLFSYYNDELSFKASEFIGLTEKGANDLFHQKDISYLRS